MKKLIPLSIIIIFYSCEKDPVSVKANPELQGSSSTQWHGTYNIDSSILWELDFYELNGNNVWRFRDGCDNTCGGSSYTLDNSVIPKTIDLNVNVGCVFEGFLDNIIKGIYKIETDTINGVISFAGLKIAISNPGLERPSSFDDSNAIVWTLDFVDMMAEGYQDTFEHDANVCYECDDCTGNSGDTSQFDPTGYRFFRESLESYDSGCSGNSVTETISSSIYWEFAPDSAISNSNMSMSGDYEWSISDSVLVVTYYMFEGGNLWDYSFTMTSDSTMYHTKDEQCNDINGLCWAFSIAEIKACCEEAGYVWEGCKKTYYKGTSIN